MKNKRQLKKLQYNRVKTWRIENPEKAKAQRIIFIMLRNKTIKKDKCFCGNVKAEAHHDDYSKPLKIIWFCKTHHMEADIIRRSKERQQGLLTL